MAVDNLKQLMIMIYEYVYNEGNRVERDYYETLVPSCLIIYDRTAYFEPDGDLRLTIDDAPRYRSTDLTLTKSMEGHLLLPEGSSILEIKVHGAMPLWLSSVLSRNGIFKTRFSKYGEAYRREHPGPEIKAKAFAGSLFPDAA